jgi:hypothetical protein
LALSIGFQLIGSISLVLLGSGVAPAPFTWIITIKFRSLVGKTRKAAVEPQLHVSHRATSLFAHQQFHFLLPIEVGAALLVLALTINEGDNIGVLLNLARVLQIAKLRLLSFCIPVKLSTNDDRNV